MNNPLSRTCSGVSTTEKAAQSNDTSNQ
uniref:Uncharacterized protein n=1 Tax=Anguilla anguilla TaxID=7936 RepID=A0A0E9QB11_ANGAN